jgi:hypothetical protein
MNAEQIIEIIKFLEHVRKNPQRYFENPEDIKQMGSFLLGFNAAYMIMTGKEVPRFDHEGWEASYYKVPYLKPGRKTDYIAAKDLVDQTLEVQANAWKRLFETTK